MRTLLFAGLLIACNGDSPHLADDTALDEDPDSDTDSGEQAPRLDFVPHLVDDAATGARHPVLVDLQGTQRPDIVVSLIGPPDGEDVRAGSVVRYRWTGGDLDGFAPAVIVPESMNIKHPNRPTFHDVDGDGDLDMILPGGSPWCAPLPDVDYCGTINWFENTGVSWVRHELVSSSPGIFVGVGVGDIDGDGIDDLVASAERLALDGGLALTTWFKGTGSGFESIPRALSPGGGPMPLILDVDGDGDMDVVVAERVSNASFVWFEQVAPPTDDNRGGTWERHILDDTRGPGWHLARIPDFYGDGVDRIVASNHTNTAREEEPDPWPSEVVVYDIPANPKAKWPATVITQGITAFPDVPILPMEAPGTFDWADLDGDGDLDLVVAGDGDPNVYLVEQVSPGQFDTHVLRGGLGRNGVAVGDINGDGVPELVVTSQATNELYVVEVQRSSD